MNSELATDPKDSILIVDDLPNNLRLLRETLTEQGYKVRSATTGAMALRGAKAAPTDLILLDIQLPDCDGYEVCRQLKADGQTSDIPVIFLSAFNETFDKVKGFAVGGADYITKPFQLEEVLARVATHLTLRRLHHRLAEHNRRLSQEIEERKQIEQALFAEKELAQVTLQSIGDAVITTDAQGCVQYLNPIAERLTGWKTSEILGRPLCDVFVIVHETTRQPTENPVTKALAEGQIVGLANHTLLIDRDGIEYAIDDSAAPIRDTQGRVIGAVMVFHDVTESRNLSRQLSWQASHDALTGLVNRRGFEQQLTEVIAAAAMGHQQHALCYLDLDQFKVVNDTCGHAAGDELLRQITALLQKRVRLNDTLARLGGDEFGLLLYQCPFPKAIQIAEVLRILIQDFRFSWQGKTFSIGASIGVVAIDRQSQDLTSVLSAADAACYAAKGKGRNCVHVYRSDDSELVRQRGERQWVSQITQALETDRFRLYCQKMIAVKALNDRPYSEILLRLIGEGGEVISPSVFLPAAERYGLMRAIDRWVIHHFVTNYTHYPQDSLYAINLSGASLNDESFSGFVLEQLQRFSVPPQAIGFEITETTAIANIHQAIEFINKFKSLGCFFALDDFGSGMSSFTYLRNLPVDYLKIDGSFIKNMVDSSIDRAMVECFNCIGQAMKMKIVAEFVENEEILPILREIGVDYAQGYGISSPYALIPNPIFLR